MKISLFWAKKRFLSSFTVKTHTGFPYGNQIFRKNYSTSSSSFILFSFHYNSQLAFSFFPDILIICLKLFCAQYLLRLIFFLMTCPNWVLKTSADRNLSLENSYINCHCTKTYSQWRWCGKPGGFSPKLCVLIRLDHALWNLCLISGLICSMKII